MRYTKWLAATAAGASLSLLSADAIAQLRTTPRAEVEAQKSSKVAAEREAGERRETRRIPVIDANAGATFRASQLIGTNITDAEGRTVGKVVDFVSDSRGNIRYPIVSYSGSAGFSGKLFAVPNTGLSFTSGENSTTTAQLSFDPQMLKNAPSFSSTRFPDFSDQAFVSELNEFYADLLAAPALDPTVPANGPGDRVQTQAQAGTPRRPIDPSLPANGPGDRPATVNPALPRTGTQPAVSDPNSRIPGTTGTENAGFPPTLGSTRAGTAGAAATDRSIVGRTGSPAGSAVPGGTVVGRTGSPAPSSLPAAGAGDNRMMLRSSQMVGMSIQGKDGQAMGKVIDFVGDSTGNSQFAVVSLGADKRNIVVPFHALNFQSGAQGSTFASLRLTPSQLKTAPSFTGTEWPDFMDAAYTSQVSEFYTDLLPLPGTSKGYDYGQFPPTSPDGTKFPRTAPGGANTEVVVPPGASKGYDYERFPPTSPDGTKFPRRAPGTPAPGVKPAPGVRPAPGAKPAPGAGAPDLKTPRAPAPPKIPRPRTGGAGPSLPVPGIGAPGVPGIPAPGRPAPGPRAAPGVPAPGGAAPGTPAPGGGAPGGAAPGGGAGAKG